METLILSRLNLIPGVDANTPLVVLEEIAKCHGLPLIDNVDEFVEAVNNNPIGVIHEPTQDTDWPLIARYINPDYQWSIAELVFAYTFIQDWEIGSSIEVEIPNYFTFGAQTPSDPARLNACVLYRLCKMNNIALRRHHSIYHMAILCQMVNRGVCYSRTILYNTISNIPQDTLIELYLEASTLTEKVAPPSGVIPEASDYEALEETIRSLSSKETLRMRIDPKTYSEAIVLAAVNFGYDISWAENPIAEYSVIYHTRDRYTPVDPAMKNIVEINPRIIQLADYFNPMLPPDLYDEDELLRLARLEGYTDLQIFADTAYTILQTTFMSYTFYHGKQAGTKNEQTPFLYEDVAELDNDLIVCFGVQGGHGSMTAFRYSELARLLKGSRNFINPLENDDVFPEISIAKLKNLCKLVRTSESEEATHNRGELYDAIITTELFADNSQLKARELYLTYQSSNEKTKAGITWAVKKLFELSMYMRGWMGQGDYPIEKAPVDNQVIVDLNVTAAILEFEVACSDLGEIGCVILDLPLLKYSAEDFHSISSVTNGRTIREKIEIVRSGDDHENIDSCIRLSSNYLAVSSYRYMQVLGMEPPFELERLRDIS